MILAVLASLADGVITRGYSCSRCLADRILACADRSGQLAAPEPATQHRTERTHARTHIPFGAPL
jgi:hypothetical protein